jgi:hypothetical protein
MKRFSLLLLLLILAGCGGGAIDGIGPITLTPSAVSLQPGGTKQLAVDQAILVDWSAPDGGTVSNGLYTAPNVNGTYHVVATSVLNPLAFGVATINVSNVQVTVVPGSLIATKNQVLSNAITAIVAGNANNAVNWSIDQSNGGTIASGTPDGSGNPRATYTAGTSSGLFTIRATSAADPSASAVAQVTVLGSTSLAVSPRTIALTTVPPNNATTFTAVLTDANGAVDTTTDLTWDLPLNPVGATLSGAGLRTRTVTVPTSFSGNATCQLRVRGPGGLAVTATINVIGS